MNIIALLIAISWLHIANSQLAAPDHYFDFTKITNVNGVNYVLDQVTLDSKNSFGFTGNFYIFPYANLIGGHGGCSPSTMYHPKWSPDGLSFFKESEYIKIENANTIALTTTWQMALWVKILDIGTTISRVESLLTQNRYDQLSTLDPTYSFGIQKLSPNNTIGFSFKSILLDSTVGTTPFTFWRTLATNSSLNEGWVLLSVSVDSSSLSSTKITMRIRTPLNGKDTFYSTINSYVFNTNITHYSKSDIYLGGYCQYLTSTSKTYKYAPAAIISRLYIWKNYANTNNEGQFDKFFFRQNNGVPRCLGYISCSYCTIEYPLPSGLVANLSCSSNVQSRQDTFLADWDYDYDNTEYILDQSGNGNHMMRMPLNDKEETDIWRVNGQGYLFDYGDEIVSRDLLYLQNYNQFTIDAWIRKDLNGQVNPAISYGFLPLLIQNSTALIFAVGASDLNQTLYVQYSNVFFNARSFTGLLQTSKWTYIAYTFAFFERSSQIYLTLKYTVDQTSLTTYTTVASRFIVPQDPTAYMTTVSFRSIFVKRIRVYGYSLWADEISALVNLQSAGRCQKLGNQSQCDICPNETNTCISTCNQNQYGSSCSSCNSLCGHCTAGTKNDCLYCNRDTNLHISRSQVYGNCTCVKGYYFDSTTSTCQACHSNCDQCFGPNYNQCLTCASGKIYYPDSICVSNCNDPLILASGASGYFQTTETINGQSFTLCLPCHPYCTSCTGSSNTQCTACSTGYFLADPLSTTCTDQCDTGFYADLVAQTCNSCDPVCATCSGPTNSDCLTCVSPTDYQQSGICQSSCSQGYYADSSKICQACSPECATCVNNLNTNCSSCNSGYYLEWLGFTCQRTCKDGTYADTLTNQCLLCHYSCETCSAGGADKCLKCGNGFYKRGSLCVTSCQAGEYIVNNECLSCNSKCLSCFGVLDSQCYACNENPSGDGYFYMNNTCYEVCPDGYYSDYFSRTCLPCKPECAKCTSYNKCTQCIFGPYQLNDGECTFFTCLNTQYRTILPSLSCYDCHSSCLTCQGYSQFDCLTCKAQHQFVAQQCFTCDDQPGMTTPLDTSIIGCQEICGDGFNYGLVQCDDGNSLDGDGCSSICMIEEGFKCSGGSRLSPDICTDIKNPQPHIALVGSKNEIYIQFDKEVTLQDSLDEKSLLVQVKGPLENYKFKWELDDYYRTTQPVQQIALILTFYTSLKGNQREQVILQFLNSRIYLDSSGNGLLTTPFSANLNAYKYIDESVKEKLEAIADSAMLATFAAMSLNLGLALTLDGSDSAMWILFNNMQLISLLPLTDFNYPPIVILVFQKMLIFHAEFDFIPNVFYDYMINRTGNEIYVEEPINQKFKDYGWKVSNFFYLSGRKILIWSSFIVIYPLIWYMKRQYADKHKYCRFWVFAEQGFRYSIVIRGLFISYLSMFLAAILNLHQMNFQDVENVVSVFFSIAITMILIYLPVQLMNILQRNYAKIDSEKFMLQYSTIICDVDLNYPLRYMYYSVFLIRRALFAAILVIFANEIIVQIVLLSLSSIAMILYIVIVKPQINRLLLVLTAGGEFFLLFLHLYSIAFLDENIEQETEDLYSWVLISILVLYILINWGIIAHLIFKDVMKKYRAWQNEKQQAKYKVQEDHEYRKWKKKRQLLKKINKYFDRERLRKIQEEEILKYQKKQELLSAKGSSQLIQFENMPIFELNEAEELDHSSPANPFTNDDPKYLKALDQLQVIQTSKREMNREKFQSSFAINTQRSNNLSISGRPFSVTSQKVTENASPPVFYYGSQRFNYNQEDQHHIQRNGSAESQGDHNFTQGFGSARNLLTQNVLPTLVKEDKHEGNW